MPVLTMAKGWTEANPVMETAYIGRTLNTYERNGHDDSDFYAQVWVPAHRHDWQKTDSGWLSCRAEGCDADHFETSTYGNRHAKEDGSPQDATDGFVTTILYATTRGWTYPNHAEADATPETEAQVRAYCRAIHLRRLQADAEAIAATPTKGKLVRVKRKSKGVEKGTEGIVFWNNPVPGPSIWTIRSLEGKRVGIETPAGRVFCPMSHVEVIEPAHYVRPAADIEREAERLAAMGAHGLRVC